MGVARDNGQSKRYPTMKCPHCDSSFPAWKATFMNWNLGYKCNECSSIFYVDPADYFKRLRIPVAVLIVGFVLLFAVPRLTESAAGILTSLLVLLLWTAWYASVYLRSATVKSGATRELKKNVQLSLGGVASVIFWAMNLLAKRGSDEFLWLWLLGIPFLLLSGVYFAKAYARG